MDKLRNLQNKPTPKKEIKFLSKKQKNLGL